jgi:hypothetical protein
MGVRIDQRKKPVELMVSPYVAQLLERNDSGFKTNPKKNAELVRRLREKATLFSDLTVLVGTKDELQQTLGFAKSAVENGTGNDTGTMLL